MRLLAFRKRLYIDPRKEVLLMDQERMVRFLGEGSGIRGIVIAFLFGSLAAGPLYAAFPIAMMLVRKGSSFRNIMIFMGAWTSTK